MVRSDNKRRMEPEGIAKLRRESVEWERVENIVIPLFPQASAKAWFKVRVGNWISSVWTTPEEVVGLAFHRFSQENYLSPGEKIPDSILITRLRSGEHFPN